MYILDLSTSGLSRCRSGNEVTRLRTIFPTTPPLSLSTSLSLSLHLSLSPTLSHFLYTSLSLSLSHSLFSLAHSPATPFSCQSVFRCTCSREEGGADSTHFLVFSATRALHYDPKFARPFHEMCPFTCEDISQMCLSPQMNHSEILRCLSHNGHLCVP